METLGYLWAIASAFAAAFTHKIVLDEVLLIWDSQGTLTIKKKVIASIGIMLGGVVLVVVWPVLITSILWKNWDTISIHFWKMVNKILVSA